MLKRIIIATVIAFFSLSAYSQNIDSLKAVISRKDYSDLYCFVLKGTVNHKPNESYHIGHNGEMYRQIVSSFYVVTLTYFELSSTCPGKKIDYGPYNPLQLITKGDTIIYCKILNQPNTFASPTEVYYSDTISIQALRQAYWKTYGRTVNENDFFQNRSKYIYGYSCWEGGSSPDYRIKLDSILDQNFRKIKLDWFLYNTETKFIHQKDLDSKINLDSIAKLRIIRALDDWLSSPITELQVYAVEGFFRLYKNGYKLTNEEMAWINEVENKKGLIYYCSGCTGGPWKSIKEVTSGFVFN